MLKRKNLINIILFMGLIFYPLPRTVEAQTCVPIPNFNNMYRNNSANVVGPGTRSVFCNSGDSRIFCAPFSNPGGDGKTHIMQNPPDLLPPNGCGLSSSESSDPWGVAAYCLPQ